jgi:parvulin-like peptidyl-prolyl isomerase
LSLTGLVRLDPARLGLPAGVIAVVNGEAIPLQEYERTLAALAQDRRTPIGPEERKLALDRLIDETLLLQRALELDLPRTDLRARRALVSAMLESVAASGDDVQPTEEELRRFYEKEKGFFQGPARLRVRQIWVRAESDGERALAEARAQAAYQRLRQGEDFEQVRRELGDPELAPIPDALLPATKLADYLGPTPLRAALELGVGEVSPPQRSTRGFHILQVLERVADPPPPLAEIRPQVLAEFRRRAGEQALRTYLDELRARASIVVDSKRLSEPPAKP